MPTELTSATTARDEKSALIAGLAAFVTWGLAPVYWKLLKAVPASEILAHRFVWTTVFLALLLTWQGRWPEIGKAVSSRRTLLYCLTSGSFISVNWMLFIWAVNAGRIIETSLGYFMTPLVNVLFGALFLRERLTRWQLVAVTLASLGVLYLTIGYGRFPWIAVVLCVSFGCYGLVRKKSRTAPVAGLFFETTLLLPVALIYLALLSRRGALMFGPEHLSLSLILTTSGIVTGLPLVWFGQAARHLRLTTVGFLQYLAPTFTFFLGVFLYREPFSRAHLLTFSLIWIALGIFTVDAIRSWRSARQRLMTVPVCAGEAM